VQRQLRRGLNRGMLVELESVPDDAGIRQGDVLRSLDDRAGAWSRWALVVTADCDLAQGKFDGLVSCVPIVDWRDYVSRFVLAKDVAAVRSRAIDRLTARVNRLRRAEGLGPSVTRRGIELWLSAGDLTRPAFEVPLHQDSAALSLAKYLQIEDRDQNFARLLDRAAEGRVVLGDVSERTGAIGALMKKCADKLKDLPGDSMLLNSVVEGREGQVIYFRRIFALEEAEVSAKSWGLDGQVRFVRVGRLRAPYKQYTAQRLGAMFDAIALPPAYEDSRRDLVVAVANMQGEVSL
jgi:hypothetical protein